MTTLISYYLFGDYNYLFSNIEYHIYQTIENTFRGTVDNTEYQIRLDSVNDMTANK